jgi:hypothetical protein
MRVDIVIVAGLLLATSGCSSEGSGALGSPSTEASAMASSPTDIMSSSTNSELVLPGEAPPGPVAAAEPHEVEEPGSIGSNTLPAVGLGETARLGAGIGVVVISESDVQIEAQGPGEISGPGKSATVEITNRSSKPLDLSGIAVLLEFGDQPGVPSFSAPTDPFAGELAPGGRATATYAFLEPEETPGDPVVRIEYSGSTDVVLVTL